VNSVEPSRKPTLLFVALWLLASTRDTFSCMSLIVTEPHIMMGKPVLEGTRITVESIVERVAAGESIADIVASHPRLTEASVRDVLAAVQRSSAR